MNTRFCISGGGRLVEAILHARAEGLLKLSGASALVDRPTRFEAVAERYSLPLRMVDATTFENKDEFRQALADEILARDADNLFLTFNWILSPSVVQKFEDRIVNLHMALLPLFKGRNAIKSATKSGMAVAGVTYHIVDEGVDTGPIIAQATHPIGGMSEDDLGFALFCRAVPLGIQVMRWIETGRLLQQPRPSTINGAKYSDGPFFPDVDDDIRDFATYYLRDNFPRQLPTAIIATR